MLLWTLAAVTDCCLFFVRRGRSLCLPCPLSMFWDLFVTWPNNRAQQKRMIEMAITRHTHTHVQHTADLHRAPFATATVSRV